MTNFYIYRSDLHQAVLDCSDNAGIIDDCFRGIHVSIVSLVSYQVGVMISDQITLDRTRAGEGSAGIHRSSLIINRHEHISSLICLDRGASVRAAA